jgi:hypothetical protein
MKKGMLLVIITFLFYACSNQNSGSEKSGATIDTAAATPAKTQPAEFADPKYGEIGKKGLDQLSSGDIDGWMSGFADNAVYVWNNGDSLVGKPAITAYWKKRRGEVIDSISFKFAIWLPIKVNQPQSVEQPGIWLLGWYQTTAKYKNGKSMTQWIHADSHFDANDKIDRVIQYLDRAPINAATKK